MKLCPNCRCGSNGSPRACPACGADLGGAQDVGGADLAGMVIGGKYELGSLIGEGAMGWVYRGIHRSLESSIAVKLMKPPATQDDTRDQRFEREARAASRLNNPHIISIMDFGRSPGGLLYIVSELLQGSTLGDLLAQGGAQPVERVVDIMDQVLSAIEEAHGDGLIHRDLKPDNIFVSTLRSGEDFVKVLDFGIAKLSELGDRRLTQHGQLVGTPAYMAPEQIRGQEATAQSDIYACGMILYELLTGRDAFPYESVMDVLAAQLSEQPPPLCRAAPERDIPPELEAVVMRCLEKEPSARYESARELCKALHRAAGFRRGLGGAVEKGLPCPECGRPVAPDARFCDQCGTTLVAAAPSPVQQVSEQARPGRTGSWHGPEIELANSPGDPSEWLGPSGRATGPEHPHLRDLAGRAATLQAGSRDDLGVPARELCRPSSTSEQYLLAHSTLNRRLRVEQTLRFELVGRERELGELCALLEEGGVVELIGPTGSGRTRLLASLEEQARRTGLTVLRAGADPGLHRTPWHPVQGLVAGALGLEVDNCDLAGLRARAEERGLIAEDLLGLRILFNLSSPDGPLELAVRRRETRSVALRALCATDISRQGLCILLDDADEYDAASRSLILSLLEQTAPGLRAVILVGERSILPAETRRRVVEPSPLCAQDVEKILRQAVDLSAVSAPLILETVLGVSSGWPFHVTQAARLLGEGGSEIESSLPDLLRIRVSRLPGDSLRLLQQVCILGDAAPRSL
ncbi:MAG: protein kinase, partial [Polyangia bacterium]|nr:protein kinase [Polyangia bacterium]